MMICYVAGSVTGFWYNMKTILVLLNKQNCVNENHQQETEKSFHPLKSTVC